MRKKYNLNYPLAFKFHIKQYLPLLLKDNSKFFFRIIQKNTHLNNRKFLSYKNECKALEMIKGNNLLPEKVGYNFLTLTVTTNNIFCSFASDKGVRFAITSLGLLSKDVSKKKKLKHIKQVGVDYASFVFRKLLKSNFFYNFIKKPVILRVKGLITLKPVVRLFLTTFFRRLNRLGLIYKKKYSLFKWKSKNKYKYNSKLLIKLNQVRIFKKKTKLNNIHLFLKLKKKKLLFNLRNKIFKQNFKFLKKSNLSRNFILKVCLVQFFHGHAFNGVRLPKSKRY